METLINTRGIKRACELYLRIRRSGTGAREQLRVHLTSQARCIVVAIRICRNGCAVIQEHELLSELLRIGGAGLASETREPVVHECTRLIDGALHLVARIV